MKITRPIALFCLLYSICGFSSLKADISEARDVVDVTINNIYAEIATDYDSEEALRASIEQSVDLHLTPVLNFEKFTRLILASHWKKASAEQRDRFTEILRAYLFRTLTKAIMEHRNVLLSYRENIDVKDARPGRDEDRAIVPVVVHTGPQSTVHLDFRMGREEDRWQAYDVIVQDVSFAINYRAILNSEIKRHGIENVAADFASKLNY